MDLYLVRHGEPDWAPDRVAKIDPPLTELGRAQAERMASRMSGAAEFDELWASSMNRAIETARPVALATGMELEVYDWLREIQNPSEWDGEPVEEVERVLAESAFRDMEELWEGIPGGESFRDFHERVVGGLSRTLEDHGIRPIEPGHRHLWDVEDPSRRVLIIAHAGTNAVVLGHLLGLVPVPWEWERFRQPHTGVSRLASVRVSTGWSFSLRQLGDIAHLHPSMVTG